MNSSATRSAGFDDRHRTLRRLLSGYSDSRSITFLYGLILVLVVGASFWSPSFWTEANLVDTPAQLDRGGARRDRRNDRRGLRGIDFSIGMTAVFVGVIAAKLFTSLNGNIPITVIAALGVGVLVGLANGLLVGVNTSNAFMITFGSFFVLTGLVLVVSSAPVSGVPTSFLNLYDATVVGALHGAWWGCSSCGSLYGCCLAERRSGAPCMPLAARSEPQLLRGFMSAGRSSPRML